MNIRRLIFIFGFLLAVLLILLAIQFFNLQRASTGISEAYEGSATSIDLAVETYVVSDELTRAVRTYVNTGDAKYEEQYNQIIAIRDGRQERPVDYPHLYWGLVNAGIPNPREGSGVLVELKEMYRRAGFPEDEIELLDKGIDASEALVSREVEAMHAVKGMYRDALGNYSVLDLPNKELAIELLYGQEYHNLKGEIIGYIDRFVDKMRERVGADIQNAQDAQNTARLLFTILFTLSLIFIAIIAQLTRLQNRRELARRAEMQQKAEDENEALNDSVINILEAVASLSQRDLTVKAPVTEDVIGTISDSINLLADETAKVLIDVTDIAGQVAEVSTSVGTQAQKVSETAEEERKNVQEMVESLFTATQTMNQVAALADQSNESAEQATQVTNRALETVNETVADMENIRETISETEKRIKRLGDRSQEISGIVNLINTISERTHALALNASMQAAVAGEAGRGFAVVAEEVQRLAESSRNATEQIATLVSNIQLETNETINTVNYTISQVVEGSEQAQKAGEQMRQTQEITAQLVEHVRNIAEASNQQKEMSGDLLQAVQRIGDGTEETAEQIAEQNQGTQALQKAAASLLKSVQVFTLPSKA